MIIFREDVAIQGPFSLDTARKAPFAFLQGSDVPCLYETFSISEAYLPAFGWEGLGAGSIPDARCCSLSTDPRPCALPSMPSSVPEQPVQRCRAHKLRNVLGYLPKDQQAQVKSALRAAWKLPPKEGMARIQNRLHGWTTAIHPPHPVCWKD